MKKITLFVMLIFLSMGVFAQYVVQDNYQPVYGVKISKSSANLKINQGIQLSAKVLPEDATK